MVFAIAAVVPHLTGAPKTEARGPAVSGREPFGADHRSTRRAYNAPRDVRERGGSRVYLLAHTSYDVSPSKGPEPIASGIAVGLGSLPNDDHRGLLHRGGPVPGTGFSRPPYLLSRGASPVSPSASPASVSFAVRLRIGIRRSRRISAGLGELDPRQ